MRLVPNPWGRSPFDNVKAEVIFILLMGLVIAIHHGSWIAAAVWVALLAITVVSWARDLMHAMQRKSGAGRN